MDLSRRGTDRPGPVGPGVLAVLSWRPVPADPGYRGRGLTVAAGRLGAFTEYALTPNDDGYDLAGAVAHLRARLSVPIYTGLPFGHVRDKLTLPIGGRCSLNVAGGRARLTFSGYP